MTDASGAVISGASVVAIDTLTGVKTSVKTDAKGFYNLPTLAIGTYDLEISHPGFKSYRKTGLVIDANSALRADASLAVGAISEHVEVRTDAVHVETQSTQMGEVIESKSIEAVPLNGRALRTCWLCNQECPPTVPRTRERRELVIVLQAAA